MSIFSDEDKVKVLSDIIEIQTINDNEIEVAQYFQQLFNNYDIESKIINVEGSNTRANLVAEIGSGSPVLGVSGHMDVVTTGDRDSWNYEPFKLTEDEDGNLHGRGSADMKSGTAALALALIEIKEAGTLNNGTIRFMATAGEEITSSGAETFYKQGYMNDVDALLIAEPSQDGPVYTHKGTMDIRVTSKGKSAHSSMPELGFNAINPLADFIHYLNEAYSKVDVKSDILGTPTMNGTVINGGDQVNSIPDHAEALFNMRTIPDFDNEDFEKLFNQIKERVEQAKGVQLSVEPYVNRVPVYTTANNKLIKDTQSFAQTFFNKEFNLTSTTATTDASFFMKDKDEDFSFVMFGPGDPGQAHQVDEYVSKTVYTQFVDFYTELFPKYLNR
ncbi:ArgE/DapE family deacylase [Staphylococcus sp. SQ8-PEA]|uniref:Probable succinyl-diaminopimelate desuccinylase n=1 Tax=Staphylococcus marylandisciuri TaxID=2981529 RepID=A0ABT2QMZ4_9STAP|nr:ArgE/DapE family deacylase [Staphylococcus marylandisciuri]MCU5745342.1 ArgE/DapE family deacylase [Staphylococcus marylandisciuri]